VKTIYVDMDDTVAVCDGVLLERYNNMKSCHGEKLTPYHLLPPYNMLSKEVRRLLESYLAEPGFFSNLPVVEGCKQVLLDWHKEGNFIYFVTKPFYPSKTCFSDKLEWVERHFPWLGKHRVIFIQEKSLLYGDVIIDDRYSFMLGFKGKRILFDLYARKDQFKGVEIATTWEEVRKLI